MKTATTLHKTAKGWVLKSGPDVPFAKQKQDFMAIQQKWPKDLLAIQFQGNATPARTLDHAKAQRLKEGLLAADARAEAKALLSAQQGQIARLTGRVNELTPRVSRERERVEIFEAKAKASKDTKFNEGFTIEMKQSALLLKSLEKELADTQTALTKLQTEFNSTKSKL